MGDENYFVLSPYSTHKFEFSKLEISKYENSKWANCTNYHQPQISKIPNIRNTSENEINCQNDCVLACFLDGIPPECKYLGMHHVIKLIPRKYFYTLQRAPKHCFDNYDYGGKKIKCYDHCKKECQISYYILNHTVLEQATTEKETFNKIFKGKHYTAIRIDIVHSTFPDILIIHLPEIPLSALICNFGGLLGMWLGISVLSCIDELLAILKKIIIKLFRLNVCPRFDIFYNFNNFLSSNDNNNNIDITTQIQPFSAD